MLNNEKSFVGKFGKSAILHYLCSRFLTEILIMRLRYYNLEIHQINSIHDFHKWGRSCQH